MRQKDGCRAQKNRAAAWHMGISLRELQKRLLNRQGAFLSFNNASACRSLLCAIFAAYLHQAYLLLSIPILASIPFLAHRYRPRYKRFLSPIHRASTQAAIPSVCRRKAWRDRLKTAFSSHKGEILTSVADFDSFPCFEAASPVIMVKAAMSGQIAFSFLYEHPDNTAVLRGIYNALPRL